MNLIKSSIHLRFRLASSSQSQNELGDRELSQETIQIVTMASQGTSSSAKVLPDIVDIDSKFLSMTATEVRDHTIKDFLSRPIVVSASAASWSTADTANTALSSYNFPDALLTNKMYQEKLKGFVGLRATLHLRLQVNSQPFQAGRLFLQYIPYAQYMTDHVSLVNSTLQGRTGCPRVDLDLSAGTECTLDIPYVSPHLYYNLITGQGSFGTAYVVVYSPLRDVASGAQTIEYTLWAWLSDIRIDGVTGVAMKIADFGPTVMAQMGLEDKQLSDNQSPSSGVGQIASGLRTLSHVPVVGNFFTKPAWISGQAANLMKLLGYSKPTIKGSVCEMKQRGVVRMANYNGLDMSHKLALAVDNELETQSGLAGTSVDEMHLSRIVSIPNYWDNFSWPAATASGILWQNLVTPLKIKNYSATVTDKFVTTHMGYVANTFGLWRGSLVYTFKFVKTQFHSGRLQISFYPFGYKTDGTVNGETYKCNQLIVDLRDSSEVTFTVPYISTRPWMFCSRPEAAWVAGGTGTTAYDFTSSIATGTVQVEILNQLKAPGSVSPDINVLVEISGGEDLSFNNLVEPNYVPFSGALVATPATTLTDYDFEHFANAQMSMGTNVAILRNDAQMGAIPAAIDGHPIDANWSPDALCIGEKVFSVRQLIKRFARLGTTASSNSADTRMLMVSPFTVTIPPGAVAPKRGYSQFEYWYTIYAFWRGSMRIKSQPLVGNVGATTNTNVFGYSSGPKTPDFPFVIQMFSSLSDSMNALLVKWAAVAAGSRFFNIVATTALTSELPQPSTTVVYPSLEGMIEYEVPYYNSSHISPTIFSSATAEPVSFSNFYRGLTPPTIVTVTPSVTASATSTLEYVHYRAPGDDYSLFYLLGVPPLVNVAR